MYDQNQRPTLDQAIFQLSQQAELKQQQKDERLTSLLTAVSEYMNSHDFDKTKRLLSLLNERGDRLSTELRFAVYNDENDSGFDYEITEHGFQSIPYGYSPSYARPTVMTPEEVVRALCNHGIKPYQDARNGEELIALFMAAVNKRAEAVVSQAVKDNF